MPRAHFSANCPNDPVANSPGVELVIGHSMPKVFELCPSFQNRLRPSPSKLASGQAAKSNDIHPVAATIRHPITGNHASGNQMLGAFLQIGALKAAFLFTICKNAPYTVTTNR